MIKNNESILNTYRLLRHANSLLSFDYIFIHVPKNAGSYISTSIYAKSIGHIPLSTYLSFPLYKNKKYCSVYRDPLDRFLSAWSFALHNGTTKSYCGPRNCLSSLADLTNYISSISTIQDLDPVFRPQSYYISDSHRRKVVDCLFPIECVNNLVSLFPSSVPFKPIDQNLTRSKILPSYNLQTLKSFVYDFYACDYMLVPLLRP